MFKKLQKCLPLFSLCFSLLLLFSAFFTALSSDDEVVMTGIKAIFGGNVLKAGELGSADINFSWLNLLAFFLPSLISLGVAIYTMSNKPKNNVELLLGTILSLAFVLSVILLFNLPKNTTGRFTVLGLENDYTYRQAKLAIGSILGLIFAMLGAISSIVFVVLQFEQKHNW